ncbi:MAG: NADH-quinone oxidoreductase subunit N [Ardenticatenales bacterium]
MSSAGLSDQLFALPAIGVVLAALVLLLVEAFWRRTPYWLVDAIALAGLLGTAWLQSASLGVVGTAAGFAIGQGTADGPLLTRQDGLAAFAGLLIVFAAAFTLLAGRDYVARRGLRYAEYTVVVLFAAAGMLVLSSAADLIMIFIGVEAFSIPLYILCAFRAGDRAGYEAALKYFVLGALAAAFLLYGTALVYAAGGSTDLAAVARLIEGGGGGATALAGLALILVGLGFKLAIVPFHQWAPDVYQGAPTPITGFMAAATKAAAAVALVRVLWEAFGPVAGSWQPVLAVLAVATMLVGNLAALVQSDMKRTLAYSAIAHAGYLLVALIAGRTGGIAAALFYLLAYGMAKLGAFAVLAMLDRAADSPDSAPAAAPDSRPDATALTDLAGLARRQPWLAAALTICLVSLVGLPPLAGFLGKWMIFQAAVDGGWTWLAIVLVLNSALSAFYYLRPLGWMYMVEPTTDRPIEVGTGASFALTVVVIGLFAALASGGLARAARAADGYDTRPPDAPLTLPPVLPTVDPGAATAGPGLIATIGPPPVPATPAAPPADGGTTP